MTQQHEKTLAHRVQQRRPAFFLACVAAVLAGAGAVQAEMSDTSQIPRPVEIARATDIPLCTVFVDAAAGDEFKGTVVSPFKSIGAAVEAAGAVICVAEGVYREHLAPGTKPFTLSGGFRHGAGFKVRDSARYVSRADGDGGSFIRIEDPGPEGDALTAIDGFEITGYSQAIYRAFYISQRFDITNNFIHDNICAVGQTLAGGGFALSNVSGTFAGNVLLRNSCGRGGAGALNDATNENTVRIERNRIEANEGTEPESAHGGALYLFTNTITIAGNAFIDNRVTAWGGGLYVGAFTPGNQPTTATLSWNSYRGNRAGNTGGGFFCDDGATCTSSHEIYDANCAGNIYLDGGSGDSGPTIARFDHLTSINGLEADCLTPGPGVRVDKDGEARDLYAFTNAIFSGNAARADIVAMCMRNCDGAEVTIRYSSVQQALLDGGVAVAFGEGIVSPADPLFVDATHGDYHLRSAFGHWTRAGIVQDSLTSPLLGAGDPASSSEHNPERAGRRVELGAYGDSPEASYVR